MKNKTTFYLGALLASVSLFAAACGGGPATPAATSAPAATIESTTAPAETTAAETPTTEATTVATTEATAVGTSEALTGTGSLTDTTGTMTDTGTMTSTESMTGTGTMTSTESMTDTGAMTSTESMTGTGTMTDTGSMSSTTSDQDIVQVATAAGNFKTLTALLTAAGLDETLKGNGPFTVFAPTDEAFAKLPKATLDDLMKSENKDKLVKILQYHVVPGKVMAADVAGMTTGKTVEGSDLNIKVSGSDVMINDSKVITPDIPASNGVIHVIDTVLMPPGS